jgi:hypothetical protein
MVGQAAMPGSVGCYVDRDNSVSLYKDGSRFFYGKTLVASSQPFTTMTMKIYHGILTFWWGKRKSIPMN